MDSEKLIKCRSCEHILLTAIELDQPLRLRVGPIIKEFPTQIIKVNCPYCGDKGWDTKLTAARIGSVPGLYYADVKTEILEDKVINTYLLKETK